MAHKSFTPVQVFFWLLSLLCLCCARIEAAVSVGKDLAVELLHMDNVSDFGIGSVFVLLGYTFQYVGSAAFFESTHPSGCGKGSKLDKEKKEKRWTQVKKELTLGVGAIISNVVAAMFWMKYIEPYTWTYGYFATHEYNIFWFLISIPAYMLAFDTWFYWTHRWLHESTFLWDTVHRIHHQFKEPSAFAQDAVHPFEAILQGPLGHFSATLICPIHPIALAVFGFLSSVFAVAAHDGREWDFNSHYNHHCRGQGRTHSFNYGLFTPLWDSLMKTRWIDVDREAATQAKSK